MSTWDEVVWEQFGAAIDMLENGIRACPPSLWSDPSREPQFWYIAFDTLFFLDYYLSDSPEGFVPPDPFGLEELDPAGVLPPRAYDADELLRYLEHGGQVSSRARRPDGRARGRTLRLRAASAFRSRFMLYGMRHLQHHAAQLNLLLRQSTSSAPRWVGKARGASST